MNDESNDSTRDLVSQDAVEDDETTAPRDCLYKRDKNANIDVFFVTKLLIVMHWIRWLAANLCCSGGVAA